MDRFSFFKVPNIFILDGLAHFESKALVLSAKTINMPHHFCSGTIHVTSDQCGFFKKEVSKFALFIVLKIQLNVTSPEAMGRLQSHR